MLIQSRPRTVRSVRSDSGTEILRRLIKGVGIIESNLCAKTSIRKEKRHRHREPPGFQSGARARDSSRHADLTYRY
jgi:hypothetical protein